MSFRNFHARFRAHLRGLRIASGLRQVDVEERAELSAGTYQQIELGRHQPRLETIWRIAQALGVPARDLFDLDAVSDQHPAPARGGPRFRGRPATGDMAEMGRVARPKNRRR